jgi:hypothetical protein
MQFPTDVQAALLFDTRVTCLEAMIQTFVRIEEARSGVRFNVPDANPGYFYRLVGGDDLMITLEYLDVPANMTTFQQPLASTITGILCPDVSERLMQNRSHILVNVSHGMLGGALREPGVASFLQQVGMAPEGQTLPQFKRRLDLLGLISRIICDHAPAQLVHWTQSNRIVPGELFDAFAKDEAPNALHVHPHLFGETAGSGGQAAVGIRTFGVRHFIGREVLIEPNILPWATNFQTILAFLRVTTVDNGSIIPHGDTFGPEDDSLSCRVLHRAAEEGDVPLYELVPLMDREMPDEQDEKRALAEGIGGRFEVRSRGFGGNGPSTPPRPAFGRRVTFGRKPPSN